MENLSSKSNAAPTSLLIGGIDYPAQKFRAKQWYNLACYLSPVYAKRVNELIYYPTYLFVDYTQMNGQQKRLGKYPIQNQPSKHAEVIFIEKYLPTIANTASKYLKQTGKKSNVFLTMNRSSCRDCANQLAKQQNKHHKYLQFHVSFAAPFAKANEFVSKGHELKLISQTHERIVEEITILLKAGIKVSATQVWPIINQHIALPISLGGQRTAERNVYTEQLIADLIEQANQPNQE